MQEWEWIQYFHIPNLSVSCITSFSKSKSWVNYKPVKNRAHQTPLWEYTDSTNKYLNKSYSKSMELQIKIANGKMLVPSLITVLQGWIRILYCRHRSHECRILCDHFGSPIALLVSILDDAGTLSWWDLWWLMILYTIPKWAWEIGLINDHSRLFKWNTYLPSLAAATILFLLDGVAFLLQFFLPMLDWGC